MPGNPLYPKQLLNDYFTFSKGQRRAIVVLLLAIGLAIVLPAFYYYFFEPVTIKADEVTLEAVASLRAAEDSAYFTYHESKGSNPEISENPGEEMAPVALFNFDPNKASFREWQQLGIRDKTIRTIQNYLSKGGHFYKPEDLRKIYGLKPADVNRLLPYVRIAQPKNQFAVYKSTEKGRVEERGEAIHPIEINTADTSAFIRLPGIGAKLASRIVNFRDKLGGFYAVEQVAETFGVADSVFQKIKPFLRVNRTALKKRNINTASLEELRSPYIPYNVANAIIRFRENQGAFSSVEGLRKIPLIDEALYVKISPYLSVE